MFALSANVCWGAGGWRVVRTVAVELRGILGDPGCGFISTCLPQQHRVEGHQFLLVSRANTVGNNLQGCVWVRPL